MQVPSVGRIVHYGYLHRDGDGAPWLERFPAIITRVKNQGVVSLTIFTPYCNKLRSEVEYCPELVAGKWCWPSKV